MRPVSVPVVALLIVASAVAAPVGAATTDEHRLQPAAGEVATVSGFANYLTIPSDEEPRSTLGETTVDVGAAVAADSTRLREAYTRESFERAFEEADSNQQRVAVVRQFVVTAEGEYASLADRRNEAIRGHANGSISTAQFVRSIARIDSRARELHSTVTYVQSESGVAVPSNLSDRLAALEAELQVMTGPVGQRVTAAVVGESPLRTVYVETADTGYAIAIVEDGTYVREAYLADERNRSATNQFRASDQYEVSAAIERGRELYPWLSNTTSPFGQGLPPTNIYRFQGDYSGGQLRAFLDGGTTNVFREHQRQRIASIPPSDQLLVTNEGLQVTVNRTYQTGPMQVTVANATTGDPIESTVYVNGNEAGTTGADGRLWSIEPRVGVPVTVETADGRRVSFRLPA